jgi:DNA-binding LacI/PurR family transcriptional regulator
MSGQRKPVSIRDVARAAGVSTTTVSHALSGRRHVSETTRSTVLEAAERLGYRPSALAQGLASRWNGLLALQVSTSDGPPLAVSDIDYFAELVNAAALRALDLGYWLALAPQVLDLPGWKGLRPDGAIVVDPRQGDPLVATLRTRGIPLVTTGRDPDHVDGYWIGSDHRHNTQVVLNHLHEQGARRIALLTGPLTASYTLETHAAYRAWSRAQGQEPHIAIVTGDAQGEPGREEARSLLAADPRPDAVYATLDRLALGVLAAARELELGVPGDLLIAALADGHGLRYAEPPITALHLNPAQVGRQAVEVLSRLIEGPPPAQSSYAVETTLRPRASTAGLERTQDAPAAVPSG